MLLKSTDFLVLSIYKSEYFLIVQLVDLRAADPCSNLESLDYSEQTFDIEYLREIITIKVIL